MRGVVHDDGLGEVPAQDAELLDVVATHTHTVLPEQAMANQLARAVQQVQQLVRIHLGGGSEEDDLGSECKKSRVQ